MSHDKVLYKSTDTLLYYYFTFQACICIYLNMLKHDAIRKSEVHNILHCCQRRTKPWPQVTCTETFFVKFGCSFWHMWVDREIYKPTDRHNYCNTSHPSQWQSNYNTGITTAHSSHMHTDIFFRNYQFSPNTHCTKFIHWVICYHNWSLLKKMIQKWTSQTTIKRNNNNI